MGFCVEKWEIEKSDLWPTHPDFQVSRPYRLWFEYLKLSPTIALAHKMLATKNGLTDEEKLLLPADFDTVIQTYNDLRIREVFSYHLNFLNWWQQVAENPFGVRIAKPHVKTVLKIRPDETVNTELCISNLTKYLDVDLKNHMDRGCGHMLLSVPMTGDKGDLLRQISNLLNFDDFQTPVPRIYGRYQLDGERIHLEPLKVGLRMLWIKAEEPRIKKWRLGLKASVSPKYAYLDPNPVKTTPEQKEAKRILGITSDRAFSKALRVMENAARGRFPCQEPVSLPEIDWESINHRLVKMQREERARYRMDCINVNIYRRQQKNRMLKMPEKKYREK